jgi:hypothetical protein
LTRSKIAQQLRPGVLGVSNDYGIGVRLRVIRYERYMGAAEYHRHPTRSIMISKLVRSNRSAGDDRDSNQVDVEIARYVDDSFIEELDGVRDITRNERRQRRKRQRLIAERLLPDTAAMTVQRTFR